VFTCAITHNVHDLKYSIDYENNFLKIISFVKIKELKKIIEEN